jgi:hypothetical protein
MNKCSRCGVEFKSEDNIVDDPCCGAPDCDQLTDRSHFECLPRGLQEIELSAYDEWDY